MNGAAAVLSDGTIHRLVDEGRIRIEPWDPSLVQPASVDLRLGDSFRVFHNHRTSAIDLRRPPENLTEEVIVPAELSFMALDRPALLPYGSPELGSHYQGQIPPRRAASRHRRRGRIRPHLRP